MVKFLINFLDLYIEDSSDLSMSRSKKKPYYADRNPFGKKKANQKVRKENKKMCNEIYNEELPSGRSYKKLFSSYIISDWSFHAPKDKKAYRK